MIAWLLLLLLERTGAELPADVLLGSNIADSFQLMTLHIYRGEYTCFAPTLNGTRKLLVFDLELNNTAGATEVRLPNETSYPLYYAVMSGVVQKAAGEISVGLLRDTTCYDNGTVKFYNGHLEYPTAGLSPHCVFKLRAGARCIWIDVSALSLQPYDVILSLEPIVNPLLPPDSALVTVVDLLTVPRLAFGGPKEALLLSIFCTSVVLFIGLYPCVMYEINRPRSQNMKSKQQ